MLNPALVQGRTPWAQSDSREYEYKRTGACSEVATYLMNQWYMMMEMEMMMETMMEMVMEMMMEMMMN